jgi:hypothetical protein
VLLRKFHRATFKVLESNNWDAQLIERYSNILKEGVLQWVSVSCICLEAPCLNLFLQSFRS